MVQDGSTGVLDDEQYRLAFTNAPIGIAVVTLEGGFARVNPALCRLTGYPAAELLTKSFQEITHPEDLDKDLGRAARLLAGEINCYQMEKRYRRPDGSYVWVNLSGSIARNENGEPLYFIAHVEDISERVAARAALEHLALHDALTGAANRQYLMRRLRQDLEVSGRHGHEVGVLVCDLDDFNHVNATFGRSAGDDVLKEVARRIQAVVRPGDTAARLAGDEFAVICPGITDRSEVFRVLERIRRAVEGPISSDGTSLRVTASMGVAFAESDDEGVTGVFRVAERDRDRDRRRRSTARPGAGASPGPPTTVRLVVVDASEVTRAGLTTILGQTDDLSVVAAVATAEDARIVVGTTDPDLVLVDVVLPDADGILLCDDLRKTMPHLGCIVLSTYVDQEALARAEQAGVAGYLSKDTRGEVLVEAVRQVARTGRIEVDDDHLNRTSDFPAERELAVLAPRELQVAYLVGDGLTNRQIAHVMGWTEKTTKNYMSRILQKLGMGSRVRVLHLVTQARRERDRSPTPPLPRGHGLPEPEAAAGR